jgi:aspartyl-tRNA synthetase
VLLLAHGTDEERVASTLGRLRIALAGELRAAGELHLCTEQFRPLWVHDFPLFSRADPEEGEDYAGRTLDATHHPFTAPAPQDAHRLLSDPLSVRGRHYDCVLNGVELGGGSIRIHQADVQLSVLRDVLGLPEERVRSFSHLLTALGSGCPPHGGIALGMDRLIAVMCEASSLREVIAFPKTSSGNELLSGAPAKVMPAQKLEYHL